MKKLVDRQVAALNALCEIQDAFKRSVISEDELQKTGRRVRREIVRRHYTAKSEKTFGRVGEVKRNPPIKTVLKRHSRASGNPGARKG